MKITKAISSLMYGEVIIMAHKGWCGKPCVDCITSCALDESIPCSPDCDNLFSNGNRDIAKCNHAGCDAITYRMCSLCDDEYDCGSDNEQLNHIWECQECNYGFCERCFAGDLGERNLRDMVCGNDTNVLCPVCFRKEYRVSKHFKANSVYADKSGQRYTVYYKPHIRGYHMVRHMANGDTICNSGVVFHRWINEFKYVGPRGSVDYEEA